MLCPTYPKWSTNSTEWDGCTPPSLEGVKTTTKEPGSVWAPTSALDVPSNRRNSVETQSHICGAEGGRDVNSNSILESLMIQKMLRERLGRILGAAIILLSVAHAKGVVIPFQEDFSSGPANWGGRSGLPDLDHQATGGMDGGGYVSDQVSFELNLDGDSIVTFRAQDELNSSGNVFVGNWITAGVREFSAYVRHSANIPLTFFTRFSSPFNFPGATAVRFQPVLPHEWTLVSFAIAADNPAFVTFEGSNFGAIFANIGHLQVGFDVAAGLGGSPSAITVDLDRASIVPEPALSFGMACVLAAGFVAKLRAMRSYVGTR